MIHGAAIENLRTSERLAFGIVTGAGAVIRKNTVQANGPVGIITGMGSWVTENTVEGNGFFGRDLPGPFAGVGSVIDGNTVRFNHADDISMRTEEPGVVSANRVADNGAAGITVQPG